jgi:hypothetical protein
MHTWGTSGNGFSGVCNFNASKEARGRLLSPHLQQTQDTHGYSESNRRAHKPDHVSPAAFCERPEIYDTLVVSRSHRLDHKRNVDARGISEGDDFVFLQITPSRQKYYWLGVF